MSRPVVAVVLDPWHDRGAAPFLSALGSWCEVRAFQPGLGAVAVLALSWRAPELARARRETDGPLVLWDDDHDPAPRTISDGAIVLADGEIPRPGIDASGVRFMPTFVRSRLRRREGLPDDLTVDLDTVEPGVVPTAAAVAAAVHATGDRALLALAAGAPLVTDGDTAARLHIRPGDAIIGPPSHAGSLATDRRRCAALSWRGRQLVEARHDVAGPARHLATRLGFHHRDPLDRALDELGTPPFARIRRRAHALLTEAIT